MAKARKDVKLYPHTSKDMGSNFADVISKRSSGSVLRMLRKTKGYTLAELSELIGLSTSYISRLEAGDRRYNEDTLSKLSQALGCAQYDLLKSADEFSQNSVKESTYIPQKDLPVYKMINGSSNLQNRSEYTIGYFDEPDKKIFRLPQLIGIKSAFAFHIVDNMNEPKYRRGDLVFINTEKPIAKNWPIVAITKANEVIVGELMFWNDEIVELSFFGNRKTVRLNKVELHAVYSILCSFDNYIS